MFVKIVYKVLTIIDIIFSNHYRRHTPNIKKSFKNPRLIQFVCFPIRNLQITKSMRHTTYSV